MRLDELYGVGPSTLKKLHGLGVDTLKDLVNFLPKTYIDFNLPATLDNLVDGQFSLIKITVAKVTRPVTARSGIKFFTADAVDYGITSRDGVRLKLVWYNQPYLISSVKEGENYLVFGKTKRVGKRFEIINPQFELLDGAKKLTGIMPVYRLKGALKQGVFRSIMENALKNFNYEGVTDGIVKEKYRLETLCDAYKSAHFPATTEEGIRAQERIAFEDVAKEILYFKIVNGIGKNKRENFYDKPFAVTEEIVKSLPYELSPTQKIALSEIASSLKSDRKTSRILIGDVGSGKTVVALITAFYAVKCGYQAAIIAPTEILAEQHYRTALSLFKGTGIKTVFHSGGIGTAEKRIAENAISSGEANVAIGTHSLFGKSVKFKNLAFLVIDEQHKFGVAQKSYMQGKGLSVDTLTLTATPIPRSLQMLLYDELEMSEIKKNGKSKVKTMVVPDSKKEGMFGYIADEAKKGNQAFVVCPRICDSEGVETYGAETLYEELKEGVFKNVSVALLHGRMKNDEKTRIMTDFASGKIKVLISTTVVEVGIDVRNATVIAVLNSERFGLATLHQLRGRVGRGDKPAYCFLNTSERDNPRINALVSCDDGLKLAEADFAARGGGDYLGTRQSGDSDGGKYAVKITPELIKRAKEAVNDYVIPNGFVPDEEDLRLYTEKFRDVTLS